MRVPSLRRVLTWPRLAVTIADFKKSEESRFMIGPILMSEFTLFYHGSFFAGNQKCTSQWLKEHNSKW
jgi:hypothetical protein